MQLYNHVCGLIFSWSVSEMWKQLSSWDSEISVADQLPVTECCRLCRRYNNTCTMLSFTIIYACIYIRTACIMLWCVCVAEKDRTEDNWYILGKDWEWWTGHTYIHTVYMYVRMCILLQKMKVTSRSGDIDREVCVIFTHHSPTMNQSISLLYTDDCSSRSVQGYSTPCHILPPRGSLVVCILLTINMCLIMLH